MNKKVFYNNRRKFLNRIKENAIVVLFSGAAPKKSADEKYKYTPNRNFYYLTGIDEENIALVLTKINGEYDEKLFIKKPNLQMEKWVGRSIREEEAKERSGVYSISYVEELENTLHNYVSAKDITLVYMDLEKDSFSSNKSYSEVFAKTLRDRYPQIIIKNAYNMISDLRLIKSSEEIEEIKKAIDVTMLGIRELMKHARVGMREYELEAYFDFICKSSGVQDFAFKTIAASGVNGTILHYEKNNSVIEEDSLILFDLGAQYNYYKADVSRTFPVSGRFTDRQKEVYNAVLRVNEKVIEAIKPGVSFLELNEQAKEWIAEECIELGLIKDKADVTNYYWHGIGHSLGLDTHDVGGRDIKFQEGMVWTVEPGIYIEEEKIGIRIEDDILVTSEGALNLTSGIIKTVEEIEAFMAERAQ